MQAERKFSTTRKRGGDFIISADLARRNLNKGQRAILLARIFSESEKGGRGKKSEVTNSAETAGFSARRLQEAREIVRRGADLADQVLAKRMNFYEALEAAQKRRKESITREEKIERIKREAPELLDLASTSLDEAIKLSFVLSTSFEQARLKMILRSLSNAGFWRKRRLVRVGQQIATISSTPSWQTARRPIA